MNGKWMEMGEPTPQQVEMTRRVERALCDELNLLEREGVPMACLLTALGMVAGDLIICQAGPQAVAPWFEKQASMYRRLIPTQNHLN
jgi:hypothetical protein